MPFTPKSQTISVGDTGGSVPKLLLTCTWFLAAVASAVSAGIWFKPFIYSQREYVELVPWLLVAVSALFIAACARGSYPKGRRTFGKLFAIQGFPGVITAITFGTARMASMEWSHYFAPERGWEVQEIVLQSLMAALGLLALGVGSAYLISGRDPRGADSQREARRSQGS